MKTVQLTDELTDLSNKLIIAATREAVGAATDLSKVMSMDLAASIVSRAYAAAAIGCMISIAHATGGSVDKDVLRSTFEDLLTMQPTRFGPLTAGAPPSPITQH